MNQLTVIIPTYSRVDTLMTCISSLIDQKACQPSVIVVDNASPSRISDAVVREFGIRVTALRLRSNTFYCGAANAGARLSKSAYITILNDDAWVDPNWAEAVISAFSENPGAGSIASLVRQAVSPSLIDSAGDHLDSRGRPTNLLWNRPITEAPVAPVHVFSAAGSCASFRRDAFLEAGGFDEDFVAYLDDIDLGFRLQLLGYSSIFDPDCRATHVGGGTKKRRGYAAKLTERNMVWNVLKNMPTAIVRESLVDIASNMCRPTPLVGGRSIEGWVRGKTEALAGTSKILRRRREVQASRTVSDDYVRDLLALHPVVTTHL